MNAKHDVSRTDNLDRGGFAGPLPRFDMITAQGGWRKVTRGVVAGAAAVATAGSLMMPSVALAAEWVDVDGTTYNAGTAAGDGSTWSWDGANDMQLNGYNGGAISAGGKLNVSYEGKNTITNESGTGITAVDGTNEKAELNIKGNESSSFNVNAEDEAIASDGDISIGGAGTINAKSEGEDAIDADGDISIGGAGTVYAESADADGIDAEGNLVIKDSANVSATGDSDGIEVSGDTKIETTGTVTAKGDDDNGLDVNGNLTIAGGAHVNVSSENDDAIDVVGDFVIGGGAHVDAVSKSDEAISVNGSLTILDSTVSASGADYAVWAYKGITIDAATVNAHASEGEAIAIFTDEGDLIIRNGSLVTALAEGQMAYAIHTRNYEDGGAGGRIFISDSTVKAIARYLDAGAGDGEVPSHEESFGIFAITKNGIEPATISIKRSNVTAEGRTAAIMALVFSADGDIMGTIDITDSVIKAPDGGRLCDVRIDMEDMDEPYVVAGKVIGNTDAVIDSLESDAIAKSAVIEVPKAPEPNPVERVTDAKVTTASMPVSDYAMAKNPVSGANLSATGDTGILAGMFAAIATGLAGLVALVSGFVSRRKRD